MDPFADGYVIVDDQGRHWFATGGRLYQITGSNALRGLITMYGQPVFVRASDLETIGPIAGIDALSLFGGPGGIERHIERYGPRPPQPGDPDTRLVAASDGTHWLIVGGVAYQVTGTNQLRILTMAFGEPETLARAWVDQNFQISNISVLDLFGGPGAMERWFQESVEPGFDPADVKAIFYSLGRDDRWWVEMSDGRLYSVDETVAQAIISLNPDLSPQGMLYDPATGQPMFGVVFGDISDLLTDDELEDLIKRGQGVEEGEEAGGLTPEQERSVIAEITELLLGYGFSPEAAAELAQLALDLVADGASDVEVMQALRQTQAWKDRFPGMELREQAGLNPISPAEYIAYENTARQLSQAAGISLDYINNLMPELIGNDVSLTELSQRISDGYAAARFAPPEVTQALYQLGFHEGDLVGFWLDPENYWVDIQERWQAAQAAGASTIAGFSQLDQQQAERLAQLDLDFSTMVRGFASLRYNRQLLQRLVGETGTEGLTTSQAIEAQFFNSEDMETIQRNQERRIAMFQGGGGAAANQTGVVGLGSSTN